MARKKAELEKWPKRDAVVDEDAGQSGTETPRERTDGTRQRGHADDARREDQRSPDLDPDSPHADVDRDDTSSST
jgi:hypothetical protein